MTKRNWGRKGRIWLAGYSPSWREATVGAVRPGDGTLPTGSLSMLPRATCPGMALPTVFEVSCINQEKAPTDLPIDQYDGGNSSTDVCIKLIKSHQHKIHPCV